MNNWIIGRRWNAVQACPNSEGVGATSANELGHVVLYPRYRETRVRGHRHKPLEVIMPLLPGYFFVQENRYLSLWELSKAKGVASIVRSAGQHAVIADTDPVMRAMLKTADSEGFVPREEAKPITLYKNGDEVLLQDCPFALQKAVIEMVDDNRSGAWIWLEILGGRTRMHVRHSQIGDVVKVA